MVCIGFVFYVPELERSTDMPGARNYLRTQLPQYDFTDDGLDILIAGGSLPQDLEASWGGWGNQQRLLHQGKGHLPRREGSHPSGQASDNS